MPPRLKRNKTASQAQTARSTSQSGATSEAEACALAEAVLHEGPHHLGVELFLDGARLVGLGSTDGRSSAG